MKKKALFTNDYRAESNPLKKFYLLERRNMAKPDSYTGTTPDKYGTRGLWSMFDVIDNYTDALAAFQNVVDDYVMKRDYDWRLCEWNAKDGPDGVFFLIKTISRLDTDEAYDRSFIEETEKWNVKCEDLTEPDPEEEEEK